MPLDAVLLEFDGVLAETAGARRDALVRALAEEGLRVPAADVGALDPFAAPADVARQLAHRTGVPLDHTGAELVTLRARRHFATVAGRGLALRPGAEALVRELAARTRLAVVAAAPRGAVELLLELAGLDGLVTVVLTGDDAPPPPDAALPRLALERLARSRPVRTDATLALVGTHAGLDAVADAGVRVVAVGELPAHECLRATAWLPSLEGASAAAVLRLAGLHEASR